MRVPQLTVIHVEHLPPRAQQRLRAIAQHRDVIAPTVVRVRSRWGPLAVAVVAAAITVGVAALGPPRSPPDLALVLGLAAVAAALATRAIARLLLWAQLPLPPGCYVFGAYLIDARRPLLVITPIVRTQPRIERRRGSQWLHVATRHGELALPLGRPDAALRALACIHGDIVAYATALACEDPTVAGHFDPLAEARDRDGTVIGEPGPARWSPRAWHPWRRGPANATVYVAPPPRAPRPAPSTH